MSINTTTLGAAIGSAVGTSKAYTDACIAALPNGVVYKGAINYQSDLPTTGQEVGDCYTVKYRGTTGTAEWGAEFVWGTYEGALQWIRFGADANPRWGEIEGSLANQVDLAGALADKYEKPDAGIPKTDLASDVQTSLGKADSALQEHQSLSAYRTSSAQDTIDEGKVDKVTGKGLSTEDYTTDEKTKLSGIETGADVTDAVNVAAAGAEMTSNKVNAFQAAPDDTHYPTEKLVKESLDGKYVKPSGGVPKTDLASDVQTSLGKADSALQEHQSLSAYRTSSAQDTIDEGKVDYITNNKHVAKDSTMELVNNALILIAKSKGASTVTTLKEIQRNVRLGLGPTLYPVGYRFTVNHSVYGILTWIVTGHNQVASATGKTYTMTIVVRDCIANVQFDEFEAIYANTTTAALAAGNYYFTISGVPYYFTTTVAIPVGGQIAKSNGSAYVPTELKSFASGTSTTALETIIPSTEAIEGAVNLGTSGEGAINHIHRMWYGSNNYKESAMRQFLNSTAAAGSVWEPKTKFDRPPSWKASLAGFMGGLPSEFLDVVDYAVVKCSTNNTYESPDSTTPKNTAYEVHDKFFLPSRMEVFGSSDVVDGSVLMSYYVGAANKDRIKLLSGSARYWWLRTPYSGNAYIVRGVYTDGSLDSNYAYGSNGCVPACIIG